MTPHNFLATAQDLAGANLRGRPRETNLRRAVSTTYYALFHCLALCCADLLVGGAGSSRSQPAWRQAYRALQHGTARNRCERRNVVARFPAEIQNFANYFVYMQQRRHIADYDPYAFSDPDADFSKFDVLNDIAVADDFIQRFHQAPRKDRRAFAIYILLDLRAD